MSRDLLAEVDRLFDLASGSAVDPMVADRVAEARRRLHGPLRVAIAGKVKAGKSTLLNALLGEELAPTDAGECTKIITWYRFGERPDVTLHRRDGGSQPCRWSRVDDALNVELGSTEPDAVDHLEVSWPSSRLRQLTVLDTPGIASISTTVSARTHRAMSAEGGRVPVADAVIYLMRHVHAGDVRFLESFHDDEVSHGTPMNSVGVLSRADEIGACRLDAMQVATTIARRYENDHRLRRLCPIVLPVDGLLGFGATTLRESEYAMLAGVARLPSRERIELLLTVDRFGQQPTAVGLTELERRHLLLRLGLFGIRQAVELIASGRAGSATALSAALVEHSGLSRLRDLLAVQFEQRSRILKVSPALAVIDEIAAADGFDPTGPVAALSEEITAGAHDFAELRLLDDLRAETVELRPDRLEQLDRLIGGRGHDPATRLGLDAEATPEEITTAALAALEQWRRVAEHPLSNRSAQRAARIGVRTIEGMLSPSI